MPSRQLLLSPVIAALLAFAGCRDAKVSSYRVPKEAAPAAAVNATEVSADPHADPHAGLGIPPVNAANRPEASAPSGTPSGTPAGMTDMASTPVPTATGAGLAWTVPSGWESRPASQMRKATLILKGASAGEQAELAVTAFPGNVGGNLANINRWRQQLQLAPITSGELGSALNHIHVGELHIDVVELLAPAAADGQIRQRVLGAIVPFNGSTWFFKLTGPDAFVASQKNAFYAFLQTLQPAR